MEKKLASRRFVLGSLPMAAVAALAARPALADSRKVHNAIDHLDKAHKDIESAQHDDGYHFDHALEDIRRARAELQNAVRRDHH